MKEYIVTKDILNIRSSPSVANDDNFVGQLNRGESIFLGDELITGDVPKGGETPFWRADNLNRVVSNDAVRPAQAFDKPGNYSNLKFNYNALFNVPDDVRQTYGEGVIVAIIDTGCFDHSSLQNTIIASYDVFLKQEGVHEDESYIGHGTAVSGLIAGGQITSSEIIGVAPLTKLVVVRAVENKDVKPENVLAALNWILKLNDDKLPDIINMSLDCVPGSYADQLHNALNLCVKKGITILAAGENESAIYSPNTIHYPARSGFAFGVGAVLEENLTNNALADHIDYVLPNKALRSTSQYTDEYTELQQCSASTAIVSGIYALFLSFKRKQKRTENLDFLVNQNLPVFPTGFDNTLKIYKK